VLLQSSGKPVSTGFLAVGVGLSEATCGLPATFLVQSNDQYGNEVKVGGEQLDVLMTREDGSVSVQGKVTDLENGIYSVTYTLEKSGHYVMDVKHGDQHIGKSLNHITIYIYIYIYIFI